MKKTEAKSLTDKHKDLTHSEHQTVLSHVQREVDEWYLNTIMLKGIDVPFKSILPIIQRLKRLQVLNLKS
jgi:hypothetical protein